MIRCTLTLTGSHGGVLDEVSSTHYGEDAAVLSDLIRDVPSQWIVCDGDTITIRIQPA